MLEQNYWFPCELLKRKKKCFEHPVPTRLPIHRKHLLISAEWMKYAGKVDTRAGWPGFSPLYRAAPEAQLETRRVSADLVALSLGTHICVHSVIGCSFYLLLLDTYPKPLGNLKQSTKSQKESVFITTFLWGPLAQQCGSQQHILFWRTSD